MISCLLLVFVIQNPFFFPAFPAFPGVWLSLVPDVARTRLAGPGVAQVAFQVERAVSSEQRETDRHTIKKTVRVDSPVKATRPSLFASSFLSTTNIPYYILVLYFSTFTVSQPLFDSNTTPVTAHCLPRCLSAKHLRDHRL